MKIKAIFLSITIIITMIFIDLVITHNNSKAAMPLPDWIYGVTYRFNQQRYANINVYFKNLDTEDEYNTTSDSNGDYNYSVNAHSGEDFYIKAWKASDPTQVDDANIFHPGDNSGYEHDFTLSPPS